MWRVARRYPQSLADRLTLSLLGAALLLATAPAAYGLVRFSLHARRDSLDGVVHELTMRLFYERCMMVYVAVGLVIYAPVSAVTLRYFSCTWYGDGHYNQHDVLLLCYDAGGTMSPTYRRSMPVAIAGLLAFVIGLPTANFVLLLRERSDSMHTDTIQPLCLFRLFPLHQPACHLPLTPLLPHDHTTRALCRRRNALETPPCRRALGLLYSKFTADSWWWDSVQMTKRLVFSSALAVLSDQPLLQVRRVPHAITRPSPAHLPPNAANRPPVSRSSRWAFSLPLAC